ncbi:hypothetical protein D3C87_2117510 [compost metagenome]
MNAADLLNGLRRNNPEAAIGVQIPFPLILLADNNVERTGILLAPPGPTVAGHDSGLIL